MLDLIDVEVCLQTRLGEVLGQVPARAYPSTGRDGDLPPLMNNDGEIYTRWLGDVLPVPTPNRTQVIEQLVTTQWETLVRCKSHAAPDRNPHQLGYGLVKLVNEALIGFTLAAASDATVLYPVRRQFIGELEGIWNFSIIWQFAHQEASGMLARE